MEKEIWKELIGYPNYEISNMGRIKNKHGRFLSLNSKNKQGYIFVHLSNENVKYFKSLHRLVALTFTPNIDNKSDVNHKNRIKTDCRASNLEWMTKLENSNHWRITEIPYKETTLASYIRTKYDFVYS